MTDDTWVWPAFAGMSMGWSWALFLANEIVVYQSQLGSTFGPERFLRDKTPAPLLSDGPVVGVYVDNVNVVGKRETEVQHTMDSISKRFADLGIPFEVTDLAGSPKVETLGMEFSFGDRVVLRNTLKRSWKLWLATKAILRRRRVSGELMRVWLGHINFFFQLARPALSSLSACYRFTASNLGRRAALWPNVRRELRTVLGLIFLVEHDLTAERSEVVHLGDSSTYGFSLMQTTATREEIDRELKFREKWRFLEGRLEEPENHDEDPEACHSTKCMGVVAEPFGATCTQYGLQLRKSMNEIAPEKLKQKWNKLFGASRSREKTMVEAIHHPPVGSNWHKSDRWTLIHAAPSMRTKEHINVEEGRVCVMGLRRWARHTKHAGKIVFSLSDSMVATLGLEKGRSSSGPMNHLCRRACAYILGCRLQWRIRHIRTQYNVADGPSRVFDPPSERRNKVAKYPDTLGRPLTVHSTEQGGVDARAALVPQRAIRGKHCLELFSGEGGLSRELSKQGLSCLTPIDNRHGPHHDISRVSTQNFLLQLVSAGLLWYIHLGTPCTIWSRARHHIKNVARAAAKEILGVQLATFSARMIRMALDFGVLFTLENPWGSLLWKFGPIADLLRDSRICFVVLDACMFGSLHRKSTGILTNIPELLALSQRCDGSHKHVVLRGGWRVKRAGKWVFENKTSTAGAYTKTLCRKWVSILSGIAGAHCFGENGPDHEWFDQQFRKAAERKDKAVVHNGPTTTSAGVSEKEASAIIGGGVVFGQHSKEEASRRVGCDFDFSFPRPKTSEAEGRADWLIWMGADCRLRSG